MLPALQLLRSQHVFNQLFYSCFEQSMTLKGGATILSVLTMQSTDDGSDKTSTKLRSFELIVDPVEMWLQVTPELPVSVLRHCCSQVGTVHPTSGHLLYMHVMVRNGGNIDCEIRVTNADDAFSSDQLNAFTQMLRVGMDIPLAVDEVLGS